VRYTAGNAPLRMKTGSRRPVVDEQSKGEGSDERMRGYFLTLDFLIPQTMSRAHHYSMSSCSCCCCHPPSRPSCVLPSLRYDLMESHASTTMCYFLRWGASAGVKAGTQSVSQAGDRSRSKKAGGHSIVV
jgi:hypothetical protein